MSLFALSESATQSVYKYLEQRTLNLVTPDVFLILTDRASLRRAVCKKSLISLICFGCVGVKHTSHRQSPPPTTIIIIVHPRARDDPNHAHVLVHPFASTRSRRPRCEPEETRARTDRFHRDRSIHPRVSIPTTRALASPARPVVDPRSPNDAHDASIHPSRVVTPASSPPRFRTHRSRSTSIPPLARSTRAHAPSSLLDQSSAVKRRTSSSRRANA